MRTIILLLAVSVPLVATAEPTPGVAGRYSYRARGPQGLVAGQARLSRSANVLSLQLGEAPPMRGSETEAGRLRFSSGTGRGARGALLAELSTPALVYELSPRDARHLTGWILEEERPVGRIVLSRSLEDLRYVGFSPTDPTAREGLRSILAGEEYQGGIPERLFRLRLAPFSREGLWDIGHVPAPPGSPGRETYPKLPLGLSSAQRDEVKVVNTNCFSCHSGVVAGQVVAGLPSTSFDPYGQRVMVDQVVRFYREGTVTSAFTRRMLQAFLGAEEEIQLKSFLDYYESILRPSLEGTQTRGDNPGPHIVWRTLARMQETQGFTLAPPGTLTPLEAELLPHGQQLPTIQPSPWWNLKYKQTSFWLDDVSHLSPTTFSLNLLDVVPEDWTDRLERTKKHLDYARQTEAPKFPGPIHEERADRGWQLFNDKQVGCAVCHGDYDREGRIDSRFFFTARHEVGTDSAYADLVRTLKPLYERNERLFAPYDDAYFYFREPRTSARYPSEPGYVAPPLVGIWASAPYLHNGSVPTLASLLEPKSRPTIWERSTDAFDYDWDGLGLSHRQVATPYYDHLDRQGGPGGLADRAALRFRSMYDTRGHGRSNQGHSFGENLTPERRRDLLEYLKRL